VQLLAKAGAIFDQAMRLLAALAIVLLVLIMFGVCAEVVMRYYFRRPIFWMEEVSTYALVYVAFLGAAWLLKHEGHVITDLVVNRLNPKRRAAVGTFTSIIGGITCGVVGWYGTQCVWEYFRCIIPSVAAKAASVYHHGNYSFR